MKESSLLLVYLILAGLELAMNLWLGFLNYRRLKRHAGMVPETLKGAVSPEEAAKSASYSLARMRFALLEGSLGDLLLMVLAAAGFFGFFDLVTGIWTSKLGGTAYVHAALFLFLLAGAQEMLSMPFSLYSSFNLEKRYGFNTMNLRTWFLDELKELLIALLLGLPLLALFCWFMEAAGKLWWLWAAAVFSALDLLVSVLYPLLIAPLFNKFSPLPDGSLKSRIEKMASLLKFKMNGIYVMDGSKRSKHSNAYFTGLGGAKRVVLYDTLVNSMSGDEILAVLGHEIGHEKRKHIIKMTCASVALSFAGFYALSLLAAWPELYAAFGFVKDGAPALSVEALLLIFSLLSGPVSFFFTPLFSIWSRKHEYEADRFAVGAVNRLAAECPAEDGGSGEAASHAGSAGAGTAGRPLSPGAAALSSALIKLGKENASNLWPHPVYSFWYNSHPTLVERLDAVSSV